MKIERPRGGGDEVRVLRDCSDRCREATVDNGPTSSDLIFIARLIGTRRNRPSLTWTDLKLGAEVSRCLGSIVHFVQTESMTPPTSL